MPVALVSLVLGWTAATLAIGWDLIGGGSDGELKTAGFFTLAVAMTATICYGQWKTRALLNLAYRLGREDAGSEVVELRR